MILQKFYTGEFLKADGTLTNDEYEAKRYSNKEAFELCKSRIVPEGFYFTCNPEDYI